MWKSLSCVLLFATPGTMQAMEFSRPEYWSGEPFPSPGDLPNPGIRPRFSTLQADSLRAEPQEISKIPEWVAYPFSRGSSWPRNQTPVSCIAGRFFTNWVIRDNSVNVPFPPCMCAKWLRSAWLLRPHGCSLPSSSVLGLSLQEYQSGLWCPSPGHIYAVTQKREKNVWWEDKSTWSS